MKIPSFQNRSPRFARRRPRAITMVEIALCLAVIAFALVAIIGVLPIGMDVQKDNREQTVVNFDAKYLMDAIRSGALGQDELTNYIIVITNTSTRFSYNATTSPQISVVPNSTVVSWYNTTQYSINGRVVEGNCLTNGYNIIGLLSIPKYVVVNAGPGGGTYFSNFVSADFRAITGSPVDQGPSQASRDIAFSYRVTIENVPSATYPFAAIDNHTMNFSAPGEMAPNAATALGWAFGRNLQNNLNEIRLRFRWPVLPNGAVGQGTQVYRTLMSGLLQASNPGNRVVPAANFYFNNAQMYTNVPTP
jgi:type II secretory pathway pseudopilin PulG